MLNNFEDSMYREMDNYYIPKCVNSLHFIQTFIENLIKNLEAAEIFFPVCQCVACLEHL